MTMTWGLSTEVEKDERLKAEKDQKHQQAS